MSTPIAGSVQTCPTPSAAGARPVAKRKDRRPEWAKQQSLPQNVDISGLDDAPIMPSDLHLRACKELNLPSELLSKTKIVAVQRFAHLMRRGLTAKILMTRGFSGLEQTEYAKKYIRKVMTTEGLTPEQRISATETLMTVIKVEALISEGILAMSEKTGEKTAIEEPKMNKPPAMFQVNVNAPGASVTTGPEKKQLASPASGA